MLFRRKIIITLETATWQGYVCPLTAIEGALSQSIRALTKDTEVAVLNDKWWARAKRRIAWPRVNLFFFPFRNPSIVERDHFVGNTFIKLTDRRVLSREDWLKEVRSRLIDQKTKVAILPDVYRWHLTKPNPSRNWRVRGSVPRANRVSVVVCFRDHADLTIRLIDALADQDLLGEHWELVLVDNQSNPEALEQVRARARMLGSPWQVKEVSYPHPFNHSVQNNIAVESSAAEVFIFLNNDARPLTTTLLQNMADYALLPGVASVGPRIVGNARVVSAGFQIYPRADSPSGFSLCESPCEVYSDLVRETSGNSFACAAVNAEAFRSLGGLDEKEFPSQYNDADFAMRARKQGWKHIYLGTESLFHEPGQTADPVRNSRVLEAYRKFLRRHEDLARFSNFDPRVEVQKR